MKKTKRQNHEMDLAFNETTATVMDYLETLYERKKPESAENRVKTEEEVANFDGFGTEHASLLLRKKK